MRKSYVLKNPIAFVFFLVLASCLLVLIVSMLKVPDVPLGKLAPPLQDRAKNILKASNDIGAFGEMMIEMLPENLAFTVFVPSETAFERDLRLKVNESLAAEKMNDTVAVVSRVLGFSAVPRTLDSVTVPLGKELSYDSLSGLTLFIWKDAEGLLVVNGVKSQMADIRKGKILVHIMDGVVMDAEFEQSVQPGY